MEKKAVSGIMLTLLLTNILGLAFNIQPVKAIIVLDVPFVFRPPLEGKWAPLAQDFGVWNPNWYGYHLGEDISRDPDTPVFPTSEGIVKFAEVVMGYTVIIEHKLPPGYPEGEYVCSVYYHLKRPDDGGIELKPDDEVSKANPIGYVSGRPEDYGPFPHLHFGIRKGRYMPGKDPRTERWYYPGYTTIYKDGVRQNNPDDPIHQQILAEWFDPLEFIQANSIFAGLQWLRNDQNPDGSWSGSVGVTSLAALAFLNAGYDETDPAVNKAIQYILANRRGDGSFGIYGTYETSTAVWALVATHNPNYNDEIASAKDWLVTAQCDEGEGASPAHPCYGGWRYWMSADGDLSNTQFALMALDAAYTHLGLEKPDPNDPSGWAFKAIKFTSRCQNRPASNDQAWAQDNTQPSYNDGGFIYHPAGWSLAGGTKSYGSMTAAGIWSLRICGVPVIDERIQAGLNWLTNNEDCSFDDNPGHPYDQPHCFLYYYYLTISKALIMCFMKDLSGINWYNALSTKLINLQYDDGHWVNAFAFHGWEDNPDLATSYAILSLQVRQIPTEVKELSWLTLILRSNADLHIYDPLGRHVGKNYETGEIEVGIPNAVYESDGYQKITVLDIEAGTYRIVLVGTGTGEYELTVMAGTGDRVQKEVSYVETIREGEVHEARVEVATIVGITIEVEEPRPVGMADDIPPTTTLTIGDPKYIEASNVYVTSVTPFTLTATDNPGGTGIKATAYRIYDATYDSGWLTYTEPFYLIGLSDGTYHIDYNSTDNAGNIEPINTATLILDNSPPTLTIETPSENEALQDGITFTASAWDLSKVSSVTFSIREPNGEQGTVINPLFESMPATLSADGKWKLVFDTTKLPDGYYLLVANGTDVLGNTGVTIVKFSIRNWATIELLPASETNKAGRTMPVKFSLRIVASVDPNQPFVRNEELTIIIFKKGHPENILQRSTYGTTARDYRIDDINELYITNFQTLKTPTTYVVQIYRKGMLIGSFEFSTVK